MKLTEKITSFILSALTRLVELAIVALRGLLRVANCRCQLNQEEETTTLLLSLCICAALASASHIIIDYCF